MTDPRLRTARCICGALAAEIRGEPADVYACACRTCQKKSGAAFSYAAIFPESAVTVSGAHARHRYAGESGRWIENAFCPVCGAYVLFRGEGLPGLIGINAGALDDPDFPAPGRLYWASRRHRWLAMPEAMPHLDTQ